MDQLQFSSENKHEELEIISQNLVPTSLNDLSSRYESMKEYCQYLEEKYITAVEKGSALRVEDVQHEAHEIIAEVLVKVAGDIEKCSKNMERMLLLEGDSIATLTNRVSLIQGRLRLNEEQHARRKLEKLRRTKKIKLRIVKPVSEVEDFKPYAETVFERYSIQKRLQQYSSSVYEEHTSVLVGGLVGPDSPGSK